MRAADRFLQARIELGGIQHHFLVMDIFHRVELDLEIAGILDIDHDFAGPKLSHRAECCAIAVMAVPIGRCRIGGLA